MENKDNRSKPKQSTFKNKSNTDYKIKKIEEEGADDIPRVFKIAIRGNKILKSNRRGFLKSSAAGVSGLLSLQALLSGCQEESEIELRCDDENCTCHVVCTCDTVNDDDKKLKDVTWTSEYDQTVCTCDLVCTCNTVCTCDVVNTCTCDTVSSGGGSYWYPN